MNMILEKYLANEVVVDLNNTVLIVYSHWFNEANVLDLQDIAFRHTATNMNSLNICHKEIRN